MRSPAKMQTIQIDITNACNKACSNCTRFCGNHKKPFFMNYETFIRAVDSLDGYDGITGVMGGEPTIHPQFERFVLYLQKKFGRRKEPNRLIYPQKEFIREIHRREFESHILREGCVGEGEKKKGSRFKMYGPGLWSNMGTTYPQYYELIQDTFHVQFLNDHINSSYHQPGLFSRKDLGIPDEEWIPMRDKCWVQNEWSATITPKGAFFCEIAGALDMLFDGPGGWKIEPGWWKRQPEEFGDQLHWCEICGFALDTFMRDAEEERDDVSPTLYKMLKEVQSPRLEAGRTNLVKITAGRIEEESRAEEKHFASYQPYIEHYEDRFNKSNSQLFVKEYAILSVPSGEDYGITLNRLLSEAAKDWILLVESDDAQIKRVEAEVNALIAGYILNPGTLHLGDGYVFFSKKAFSLRSFGYDGTAHLSSSEELKAAWQPEKVIRLADTEENTKWKRPSIETGKRYVLWGTGLSGGFIGDVVQGSGGELVYCIDVDTEKTGKTFLGAVIYSPEYLREHQSEFDYLLIGHYSRYNEIRDTAIELGIDAGRIIMPYEV